MPSPSVFSSCPPAARIDAADDLAVAARGAPSRRRSERLREPRGALDVGEQEGHGPGGALALVGACALDRQCRCCVRDCPQPAGQPAEDREGDRRRLQQRLLEVPRREARHTSARRVTTWADPRQPVEDRQLAEEVARPQDRDLVAAAHDLHRAGHDQEEPRPDLALAGDHVVRREVDLDGSPGDRREIGRRRRPEEPAAGQELGPPVVRQRQRVLHRGTKMMLRRRALLVNRQPRRWQRLAVRSSLCADCHRRERRHGQQRRDRRRLAGFALFADLATPQLNGVAHIFEEQVYSPKASGPAPGPLRIGVPRDPRGRGAVPIDGQERATLGRGDFFGDVSILLGQPPVADIVATRPAPLPRPRRHRVQPSSSTTRTVMYRMLQAQARRLRQANRWRS